MKKLLVLALTLGLTFSTVACGNSESSDAQSEDSKELVYWSMWNSTEPQAMVIQEAVDAYEEESGNTVIIEWKGRDISTFIQASLDAGEQIDLFDTDYRVISQQYADNLMNLEEMASAVNYDDYAVEALPTAVRKWAGSLVCIPYQPYTSGVYYNKEAFEKAGITSEPTTWEEFLTVCEKLKEAGYVPLAQDDAYVRFTLGFHLARYMSEEGVSDMVKNGTWGESEEALKAANEIAELRTKGYLSETAPDVFPDGQNEVGFETAAMVVNASWVPGEIENNTGADLEWGMFNYPTVENGKDPSTIANVGAQGFAIPSYSENGQEAFDFIIKITTGEFDQKMALESNTIPADTRNEEWPEIIAGGRDAFNSLTDVYNWNMGLNDNDDTKELIQDAALKLFDGTYTGQEFIDALATPK